MSMRRSRSREPCPTAWAVVRLSPVSMTTRMLSALSAASASGVDGFIGSAMAITPAAWPSTPTKIAVAPSWRRSCGLLGQSSHVDGVLGHELWRSRGRSRWPSTVPSAPRPTGESKSLTGAVAIPRAPPPRRWRAPADARSRARRWPRGAAPHLRRSPAQATIARHRGLAFGERAGLVDDQRVDLLHALQRLGVLDEHAGLSAPPDADHDRHRRREAERAGAGDDEHRHRRDQPVGEARLRPEQSPRQRTRARATPMTAGTNQPETWSARRWIGRAAALRLRRPSGRCAPAWCRARPCRPR